MTHFVRHLLEMTAAMAVGMAAGAAAFGAAAGMTPADLVEQRPVAFVAVMAFSMTAPMVAWMWLRGHSRRSCGEMAAAMVLPAAVLICLRVAGAIGGPICGAYCAVGLVAMLALMLYRRDHYGQAVSRRTAA